MKILSVQAKNFRSYSDIHWIPGETGLTLVDGVNPDTGRSNTSGKTTLFDSVFWGLYGYLPKWGGPKGGPLDAVIKRGTSHCWVRVNVENSGHLYEIERHRPNRLKVTCDGSVLDGKSSDLDHRIRDLIGVSPAQFLISVYIAQDRNTSFFSMGDTERARLLSVVAGLENVNRALERAKLLKRDAESKIDQASGALAVLQEQVNDLPNQRNAIEARTRTLSNRVTAASQDLSRVSERAALERGAVEDTYRKRLKELEERYQSDYQKLNQEHALVESEKRAVQQRLSELPKLNPEDGRRVQELKRKIADAEEFNLEQKKAEVGNLQDKIRIERLCDLIAHAHEGKCETCGQDLPDDQIEKNIAEWMDLAKKAKERLKPVAPLLDVALLQRELEVAQEEYTRKAASLEALPAQIRAEIQSWEGRAALIKSQLATLESRVSAAKRQAESQKEVETRAIEAQVNNARAELRSAEDAFRETERALEMVRRQEESLVTKRDEAKVKLFTLREDLDQILDLMDLFGPKGVRTVFFDEIIERIGSRAGQLLQMMTDGIYSTRIDQLGENSSGEQTLILRPIITKGGVEVPEDDLSGGARRMAMLAYDIAVSEAVGDCNILLLDEALDGLDSLGKAEAVRLLEEVARTRAVFIIDHTSEIKSGVSNLLKVIYRDGTSYLDSEQSFESTCAQKEPVNSSI
jgi:DNA repair exonuclease SbcCD ATPase subunit